VILWSGWGVGFYSPFALPDGRDNFQMQVGIPLGGEVSPWPPMVCPSISHCFLSKLFWIAIGFIIYLSLWRYSFFLLFHVDVESLIDTEFNFPRINSTLYSFLFMCH
jgi:hypothetical protein